jgi:hypothetical protein
VSDAVASQLISDDYARYILETLQQTSEESRCGFGIAPRLNEDVEYDAGLIDGSPEIVLNALDPDEHLIKVPLVPRSWPAATQTISEILAEFLAPSSHRLIRNGDAPCGQQKLDITEAHTEHMIRPHGMADNLGGEAGVGSEGQVTISSRQIRRFPICPPDPVNVTMPV